MATIDDEELIKHTKEIVRSSSPLQIGKYLYDLGEQLRNEHNDTKISALIKLIGVRGSRRAILWDFIKIYGIYMDCPSDVLDRLSAISHSHANVLARVYHGKLSSRKLQEQNRFRMDRIQALDLALSRCSAKTLATTIEVGGRSTEYSFANEREIEVWFRDNETFRQTQGIESIRFQVAAGRALGDIDFIGRRTVDPYTLVILELKDTADYDSIGQILAQRNELVERSEGGIAYLYLKHKTKWDKYKESNRVPIPFQRVEVGIVAQSFAASAYYAAKDQDILLFRITGSKEITGPCYTKNMTKPQWLEFTDTKNV